MHKKGDLYEFILNKSFEGIEINIYKKYSTGKLMKIDFSITKTPGFALMNSLAQHEVTEVEEGLLLYTGDMTIYQLLNLMKGMGYKVGIENVEEVYSSPEEVLEMLNKKLKKALNEEDYLECAKIRDEIKKYESI